jgi:uncharacterized protein
VAGICQRAGGLSELPPVWLVYFGVKDLEASLKECRSLGGTVVSEPIGKGLAAMQLLNIR